MVWYGAVGCGTVGYGAVWCGTVLYSMIRCGAAWCGTVQYGAVWCCAMLCRAEPCAVRCGVVFYIRVCMHTLRCHKAEVSGKAAVRYGAAWHHVDPACVHAVVRVSQGGRVWGFSGF